MLAFGLPGPMELIVIGIIFLFIVVLPLTALIAVFIILAQKRKRNQLEQ